MIGPGVPTRPARAAIYLDLTQLPTRPGALEDSAWELAMSLPVHPCACRGGYLRQAVEWGVTSVSSWLCNISALSQPQDSLTEVQTWEVLCMRD